MTWLNGDESMKDSRLSLHPDHLKDLRRSGLYDETIAEARIYSVPPTEIPKLLGWNPIKVESAYLIPYPGKDGFFRMKIFPTYIDEKGGKVSIYSAKIQECTFTSHQV